MEHELPPPTPPKTKADKKRLLKEQMQHKEAMAARFGNWRQRCVIGHSEKRYLKYPEARYNPLASISGDLLVAALYAGSVDLDSGKEAARSGALSSLLVADTTQRPQGLPPPGSATPTSDTRASGGGSSYFRSRHASMSAQRKAEEGFTMQHLSTTRSPSVAMHAAAATKTLQSVIDSASRQSILRMCVMGSDAVVHRTLCNYVAFRHEYEKRFQKLSIRVYVVPTARHNCQLASYLAREDAWYRRQIFAPFCAPILISPRITPADSLGVGAVRSRSGTSGGAESSATWGALDPPTPVGMTQELLQDYVRSARYVAPLCVFDCECWEPKEGNAARDASMNPSFVPDMTVPFCLGMEIGICARAELFRRRNLMGGRRSVGGRGSSGSSGFSSSKNKKGSVEKSTPLNHVLCSKAFRKTWCKDEDDAGTVDDISLTYMEVGPSGTATGPMRSIAPGSYFRVALRNVSLHAEAAIAKGCASRPGFSSMDMHLLDRGSATQFGEALQRASATVSGKHKAGGVAAAQGDVDRTVQTMLSEGRRLQVTDLEIASASEFHILVDGELVGPFSRVRIRPCTGKNGEPVHFPVSTFSPLSTV